MLRCLMSLTAVLVGFGLAHAAGPQRNFADAALRAVQFIDASEGWAVGDDGVIWHTIDGGAAWERQPTGVRGSLRGLHFINPYTGWVVGREELPGGGSAGVVLVTTDGGLKWSRLALNTLPGLHAVKFFDDRRGVVAGDSNDRYASGVFATADGGQTWTIVPGPRQPGWLAADFRDPKTGALAGAWGSVAMVRDSVFGKCELDLLGSRSVLGLRLQRDTAIAVGQGGLILRSDDGGARWKNAAPRALAGDALTNCDFHAVAMVGEHAWVAGRPGSAVLHSADYGRTWEVQTTGQSLPLHGVHFADARAGWAVGELGTILATADGGKTWKVQRRGGERAAALFIHAGPKTLALDTIAQLGADDGYLCAALRVMSAEPASAALRHAADAPKWAAAVRAAGGAAGECLWHFPVATCQSSLGMKELLAALDPLHGGGAGEIMLRQMVLAIRMWQPEVVVCDEGGDGPTWLCAEAMREAFQRAADPKAFAEQVDQLGLKPWTPSKLYVTAAGASRRQQPERIATTEILSRCGESARDIATVAAEALAESIVVAVERGFTRHLPKEENGKFGGRPLMRGVMLAHGGTARREQAALTPADLEALEETRKHALLARNIEALARPDWRALGGPEKVLGQLGSMLRRLPPDRGARAAFAVASTFARDGQWLVARDAFELMAERYPAHPLTAEAYRWLARYAASGEARRRHELGQFVTATEYRVQQAGGVLKGTGVEKQGSADQVTSENRTGIATPESRQWHSAALGLEPKMAALGSLYLHDPAFQFALQSARRATGEYEASKKWFTKFVAECPAGATADPWREAGGAELRLTEPATRSPRPAATCRATSKRPHLDGQLDDDCWQDAKPLPLRGGAGTLTPEYTGKAMFAHDREFLYIAVQCQHPAGRQVPKVEKRKRDEDLGAHDRVGILLDIDRDFQTCYHLQIDQRGCLCEDCWGDRTWDPKWYAALHSDATGWTAEVAIPLAELTGRAVGPGQSWACNVVRIVPGTGVMAWSLPADVEPRPEGMGLLLFAAEEKK